MADCDNIPTLDTIQKLNTNAKVFNEVVTASSKQTTQVDSEGNTHKTLQQLEVVIDNAAEFTDSPDDTFVTEVSGETKKTVTGLINEAQSEFDSQLSSQQSDFSNALNTFETESQAALDTFDANQAVALANAGYNVVGNFADGATLTGLGDAVYYAGDPANEGFYAWNGVFPKIVTAGSTPFDESGWMLAATGYTKQSGVIQLFGQNIDADFTIPLNQNALSINPTVADGVTVTIPTGSTYVVLGSTN